MEGLKAEVSKAFRPFGFKYIFSEIVKRKKNESSENSLSLLDMNPIRQVNELRALISVPAYKIPIVQG